MNGHPKDSSQEIHPCQGKLILDKTCAPAGITYPTGRLGLLKIPREELEKIIDMLHAPHIGNMKKPRNRGRQVRRDYLRTAKNREPRRPEIRKAIGPRLRYETRDSRVIEQLVQTHTTHSTLETTVS